MHTNVLAWEPRSPPVTQSRPGEARHISRGGAPPLSFFLFLVAYSLDSAHRRSFLPSHFLSFSMIFSLSCYFLPRPLYSRFSLLPSGSLTTRFVEWIVGATGLLALSCPTIILNPSPPSAHNLRAFFYFAIPSIPLSHSLSALEHQNYFSQENPDQRHRCDNGKVEISRFPHTIRNNLESSEIPEIQYPALFLFSIHWYN